MRNFVVFFACAALLLVCGQAYAQVRNTKAAKVVAADTVIVQTARNNVYLEVLGSAVVGSLNYERMISESNCLRIGLLLIPAGIASIFTGATSFSILIGKKQDKLELGGGLWFFSNLDNPFGVAASGIIGYRYQPLNGGFLFRVAFTPLFGSLGDIGNFSVLPWGGISFGWNF